jgi:hypothetical protein
VQQSDPPWRLSAPRMAVSGGIRAFVCLELPVVAQWPTSAAFHRLPNLPDSTATALRHRSSAYTTYRCVPRIASAVELRRDRFHPARTARPLPNLERAAPSGHNHRTIHPTSTKTKPFSFEDHSQARASETILAALRSTWVRIALAPVRAHGGASR